MQALITIQSELKAPKNQFNSFGKYKYRNCEDILEAVKPLLKENNCLLFLSDQIIDKNGRYYVEASVTFIHEKFTQVVTAYAREEQEKKGMDGAQVTGAASSYARKYALNGLFLIDDTKDADTQDNAVSPVKVVCDWVLLQKEFDAKVNSMLEKDIARAKVVIEGKKEESYQRLLNHIKSL